MYTKMNNWKLKAISIFCQIYFALICTLTIIVLLNVTIPTVCETNEGNKQTEISTESYTLTLTAIPSRHRQFNFVALFLFCSTVCNYICLRYTARLSTFNCGSFETAMTFSSKSNYRPNAIDNDNGEIVNDPTTVARHHDMNVHSGAYKINETDYFSIYITSDSSTNQHLTLCNNNEVMKSSKLKAQAEIEKTAGPNAAKPRHWELDFAPNDTGELCLDKNMNNFFQYSTDDWHLCRDCNMMAPPRAKHCPICHHCVLKRDHHCFFADCCIGYHNQRYFISFCLYGGLGTLFSAVTMSYYLDQNYTLLQTLGYISYLPPVIVYSWMYNNSVDSFIFAMLIFQYLSVITCAFCFYLCITQLYLACTGLTTYEYMKSIHKYRATLWRNIHSVFGRYWFVGFVIPAPCFGYVSDGIHWDSSFNSKLL